MQIIHYLQISFLLAVIEILYKLTQPGVKHFYNGMLKTFLAFPNILDLKIIIQHLNLSQAYKN